MGVHVTAHAVVRFIERVRPCSEDQARIALSTPAISVAADFGAHSVKLGTGHRIVIEQGCIITVLPKPAKRRRIRREV